VSCNKKGANKRQPRVDDRELRTRLSGDGFSSEILPKYLRRTPSLDNLVPALYLRDVSTQDFLAAHWQHIQITNPIESTFATVRLRMLRTKGCGSSQATLTMVFKLAKVAEK